MAEESLAVIDAFREVDRDFLRALVMQALNEIMDVEVTQACNAPYGVRSSERTNYRNGYRRRAWDTRAAPRERRNRKIGAACVSGSVNQTRALHEDSRMAG